MRSGQSLLRFLRQIPVEEFLRELDALELEQLRVGLDSLVERQRDLPRPRERLWVLDRRLVLKMIITLQGVALGDLELVAVVVAGAVEPSLVVVARDFDHER